MWKLSKETLAASNLVNICPLINVSSFKRKFKDYPVIIKELNHMEQHINDDKEYYCGYEYLRQLINDEKSKIEEE